MPDRRMTGAAEAVQVEARNLACKAGASNRAAILLIPAARARLDLPWRWREAFEGIEELQHREEHPGL